MSECCLCFRIIIIIAEIFFAVIALVLALIASARIHVRSSYSQYFVGSGDQYETIQESDRLQRLALILGISGYWVYIAVVISVAVGLGISSNFFSSKCLPLTWLLTAVMFLVSIFALCTNITSLVFTFDATNKFNSAVPKVMLNSLRHSNVNESLADSTERRSEQVLEENKTESSVVVLWRELQSQRQCCGYGGIIDYVSSSWNDSRENQTQQATAPLTCCRRIEYQQNSQLLPPRGCLYNGTDPADYYAEGCFSVLSSSVAEDKDLVISLSCFVILLVVTSIVYVIADICMDDDDD